MLRDLCLKVQMGGPYPRGWMFAKCHSRCFDWWFSMSARLGHCALVLGWTLMWIFWEGDFETRFTFISCSFMRWSVKCGHKRKQRRGPENKVFYILQVLEMGGMAHFMGPNGEAPLWAGDRGVGARGRFRPQPLLGFLWGRQGRIGNLFRSGWCG